MCDVHSTTVHLLVLASPPVPGIRRAGGCVGVRAVWAWGRADLRVPTRLTRSRAALAIEESPKIRIKPHRKVASASHAQST